MILNTTSLSSQSSCPVASFQSGPASLIAEDISTNSNGPRQNSLFDDDPEDLFAGTHTHALARWVSIDPCSD